MSVRKPAHLARSRGWRQDVFALFDSGLGPASIAVRLDISLRNVAEALAYEHPDGKKEEIVQFNMIPEYCGKFWQVQYLLQFLPDHYPKPGVWHEIKVEVQSKENLHGKEIIDFGQGSVGFYRP